MTWSVNRFQFILLASVTLVIGHQSLPDAQFWKGKIKIVLPDTAYAAPLFWDHFPATMHAGGQTIRQPVDRICFDFSKAVPSVVQAEVLTLLSHVPDLETGGVCTGENDLSIAVATSDMLESEEIYLRCDAQRGHRVLHVLSGVGNGTVHPVGTALLRALSLLGFSFLHPLAPYVPPRVTMPLEDVSISEVPHLKIRGIHLHTMHPIELTDFLNGWGPLGIDDDAGFQKSFLEWHSFLVWMLANGLDRVQWALLWNEKWSDFAESQKRQSRLRQIVDVAHLFGVEVGIDAPVSLRQQNAFRLVRQSGTLDEELTQIQRRIDYLMGTGIDFLALESGTSEFTHSSPMRMLARLNYIAAYLDGAYDSTATIKVHVSSGQRVDGLVDPVDGGSLNINFLPWYADTRLGVMPHTVAYYGLGDIAPVYGNSNFDHIEGYLYQEVGQREVVWYPESAYWCSFDVDVPLFLPLYGERRLSDMRRLERARQSRSDGPQ